MYMCNIVDMYNIHIALLVCGHFRCSCDRFVHDPVAIEHVGYLLK